MFCNTTICIIKTVFCHNAVHTACSINTISYGMHQIYAITLYWKQIFLFASLINTVFYEYVMIKKSKTIIDCH